MGASHAPHTRPMEQWKTRLCTLCFEGLPCADAGSAPPGLPLTRRGKGIVTSRRGVKADCAASLGPRYRTVRAVL